MGSAKPSDPLIVAVAAVMPTSALLAALSATYPFPVVGPRDTGVVDDVVFEYSLLGDGFHEAGFGIGEARLDLILGDSPDPLEELMTGALALGRGDTPSQPLLWDPEDGGDYHWYLSRAGDRLHIRVHYKVSAPSERARAGRPRIVFEADCLVESFCRAVCDRAAEVIERYGPVRYAELNMGDPFPYGLLAGLQVAMARISAE